MLIPYLVTMGVCVDSLSCDNGTVLIPYLVTMGVCVDSLSCNNGSVC